MEKPLIAVTPFFDDKKEHAYSTRVIFQSILDNGGTPLVLPLVEEFKEEDFKGLLARVDGFLFTGGHDFPASYYREENSDKLLSFAPLRDTLEFGLMPMILERDIPTLGICRGMQLINVCLGGSLYQHIEENKRGLLSHNVRDLPYWEYIHRVVAKEDPNTNFFGSNTLRVNSLHHQAVKEIGRGLKELLWSEDGLLEAFYGPKYRYLVGVQWHPEYLYKKDKANGRLFESFIEAASLYRQEKEK